MLKRIGRFYSQIKVSNQKFKIKEIFYLEEGNKKKKTQKKKIL